jgi:flagella basal body P-ring formation protein FlgA
MKMLTRRSRPWQLAAALGMIVVMAAFATAAHSAEPVPLSGQARSVIEQFLVTQTAGRPGKVRISIDTPRSGDLPHCDALEAFLPRGAQLRGRVSVGVRCNASQAWTRYVQAYIAVVGTYYVAARQIEAGQALVPADTAAREADITTLPASIIVDSTQLGGMVALNRIASGAPIRRELLRGISVVQQGQNTKVVTQGPGFMVSTEGKAMTDAAVGALVQVKIQGGQLISGIVRPDGIVERAN